jgi:major outer membrane protein
MRLRRTLVFLALAVAVTLAAGNQARADDYKGWFVWLDLADTQPNSLDQHYANTVDFGTGQEQVLTLENDPDFTWKLGAGYSWGKMGMLKVSYWTFDNEDKESGTVSGYMVPTVFGYGAIYYYQTLYNPTFEATGKVQATTFDIDYARPFPAGEKMTISWMAGLRVANYEETQKFTGTDATYTYTQQKHFENKGWGPRVGVNVDWGFTKRFSLGGTAAFSFMQVKTDGDASQSEPGVYSESLSVNSDNERGLIMDFDLRAIWTWDKFGVWVGYEMSDWGGIATNPFPPSNSFVGPMGVPGRDDVSFNSWHTGVKWKFGGGK